MGELNNTVKIAVLEEQIKGVREQHKQQYDVLDAKFDTHAANTEARLTDIDKKMDDVLAFKNQQKGVIVGISAFMGAIGGFIVKLIHYGS